MSRLRIPSRALLRALSHFLLIGGVAFGIDALTYWFSGLLLQPWLPAGVPALQKVAGFAAGVSTTYLYNSMVTFSAPLTWSRYRLYVGSQLLGMVVNLLAFLLVRPHLVLIAALATATGVAVFVNFFMAKAVLRR